VQPVERPIGTDAPDIDPEHLRLLYDLGCAFAGRARLEDLVELVLEKCREVLSAESASILLHDPEREELYFPYVAEADAETEKELQDLRFPAHRGIAGAVLKSGQALKIDDTASDPRFFGGVDRRTGVVTRNMLCAPLRSHHGPIGVIQVRNHKKDGFRAADLAFLDALGGSVAVAIENARMYRQLTAQVEALERAVREHNELLSLRRELDIARDIQQSILPRSFPDRPDLRIFGEMIAAQEIGGDFYDFFFLDEDRIGILIGDVSGKGVPAALFMAMTRTVLRSAAPVNESPGECLRRVNELLIPDNRTEMFVTVFYGILDIPSGLLRYSNGGHNLPYMLRSDGRIEALPRTGGTVLGMLGGIEFGTHEATLGRGESLVLFTDGITEAMNTSGELFGESGLETALAACSGCEPRELVRSIRDAVERHAGAAVQSDDLTALVLRR
jgi:sigma-B regulation protein RsbU (phosphoserine phosphatase)